MSLGSLSKRIIFLLFLIAGRVGICSALFWVDRAFGRRNHVVVLTYHHLSDGKTDQSAISELQKGTRRESFDLHIRHFKRWHASITLSELKRILDSGQTPPGDHFLVTFDDGYRDNFSLAMPCLARYSVNGVIFIATAYIDSEHRFWWVRLTDSLMLVSPKAWAKLLNVDGIADSVRHALQRHHLYDLESRRQARAEFGRILANLTSDERDDFLSKLEMVATRPAESCLPLLSWDQIREMQDRGIEFGGHTHTHPLLTKQSTASVREELRRCLEIMEQETGKAPLAFAYPSGDLNRRVESIAADSGFNMAFTTRLGTVGSSSPRYRLPRIYISGDGEGELMMQIFLIKMSKYFPRLAASALSRLTGQKHE